MREDQSEPGTCVDAYAMLVVAFLVLQGGGCCAWNGHACKSSTPEHILTEVLAENLNMDLYHRTTPHAELIVTHNSDQPTEATHTPQMAVRALQVHTA